MIRRGMLLTMTEPPAAMETEFNAWYDTEHLPERLAIPGFRSARRWVADCSPGEGKYLATYELDRAAVLDSPEYLAHVGENFTPWTKRCLEAARVFRRWVCEQAEPGEADPDPTATALVMAAADASAARVVGAAAVLQVRRFIALSGAPRFITLYELREETNVDGLRSALVPEPGPDSVFRLYRAYDRSGRAAGQHVIRDK